MNAEAGKGMCCRNGNAGFSLRGLGWRQALRAHPRTHRGGSRLLPPQPFSWPYPPVSQLGELVEG